MSGHHQAAQRFSGAHARGPRPDWRRCALFPTRAAVRACEGVGERGLARRPAARACREGRPHVPIFADFSARPDE